jgi:hypothetical protein
MNGVAVMPCPFCSVFAARSHQAKCNMRSIQCSNCGVTVTAGSLSAHGEMCPAAPVKCGGCSQLVQRDCLRLHLLACVARSFTCADCGQAFWIAGEFLEHCVPSCRSRIVSCQLCGTPVATAQLAEHYAACSQRALRTGPSSSSQPPGERHARPLPSAGRGAAASRSAVFSRESSARSGAERYSASASGAPSSSCAGRRSVSPPVATLRANPGQLRRILAGEKSVVVERQASPRPTSPQVRHTRSGAYQASISPPQPPIHAVLGTAPAVGRVRATSAEPKPPPLSRSHSGGSNRSKSPRLSVEQMRQQLDEKRARQSAVIRQREKQQRLAKFRNPSDDPPASFTPR